MDSTNKNTIEYDICQRRVEWILLEDYTDSKRVLDVIRLFFEEVERFGMMTLYFQTFP